MTRNIYMAGKISKGDWREAFVPRMRSLGSELYSHLDDPYFDWPITLMENGHNYTGPYFVACDHGCFHGPNQHGVGASGDGNCYGGVLGDTRRMVFEACIFSMALSDTIFAWIDSTDCYGTIAELGHCHGGIIPLEGRKRQYIWIAGPKRIDDLWFVYAMADDTTFNYSNPADALAYFLRRHDPVDYRTYILSDEWKDRATAAKEAAGWRCQVCNRSSSAVTLDAHHRTYERLGHERPDDVTVLCRDCHELYETGRKARRNGGVK